MTVAVYVLSDVRLQLLHLLSSAARFGKLLQCLFACVLQALEQQLLRHLLQQLLVSSCGDHAQAAVTHHSDADWALILLLLLFWGGCFF